MVNSSRRLNMTSAQSEKLIKWKQISSYTDIWPWNEYLIGGGKGEGNEAYFEKYDGIKKQIFIQIVHKFFFSLTTTFAVFLHYLSVTL